MYDLFQRLDDTDWAALTHAYGDAADVPGLLRGLAADDPAAREHALDALYGGVHHQGDVYDSTLACLPFLCALAAEPEVRDRDALLGLIGSIAQSGELAVEYAEGEIPDPRAVIAEAKAEDEWWEEVGLAHGMLAHEAFAELLPPLTALLGDHDPAVRGAAAGLLASRHRQPRALLELLVARVGEERDGAVRYALAGALGTLAGRLKEADGADGAGAAGGGVSGGADGAGRADGAACAGGAACADGSSIERAGDALLVLIAEPGGDPGTELAVLAALARHLPERLPADTGARARAALDRSRERPAEPAPEPRPDTPTLLSHLRTLRAESFAEGADERTAEALGELFAALGDQVELRHELVLHTLRHGDPNGPRHAVRRAVTLHTGWRTSPARAAATAELLGELLRDPDPELAADAAEALREGRLPCGPELLDTAAAIMDEGRYPTGWGWERNLPGQCMQLLANHGDERAAEELAKLLKGRAVPEELATWCERLRPHSRGLLLPLVRRARAEAEQVDANQGDDDATDHDGLRTLGRLIAAMAGCGLDATHMVVATLLRVLLKQGRERDGKLHPGPQLGLSRPYGLGPEPGDVLPVLRDLLTDPAAGTRVLACRSLFHGGQDPAEYLPVLAGVLDDPDGWDRFAALDLLAELGPAAAPLGDRLRDRLDAADRNTGSDNELVRLLLATRAATPVTPVDDRLLTEIWWRQRQHRPRIAEALRREGGPLPAGFAELLREELADPRRHNNDGKDTSTSFVRYDCLVDDTLLEHCRELLG